MLLSNVLSTFPIKGNPVFNNGPKDLPKNPPNCPILCKCVFVNFILAKKLCTKALPSFETGVLVDNNLCRKQFSSLESPTTFDEISKLLQYHFLFLILIC